MAPLRRPPSSFRHQRRRAVATVGRTFVGALVLTLLVSACSGGTGAPDVDEGDGAPAAVQTSGADDPRLVVVLPPADGLADVERTSLRRLVERALTAGPAVAAVTLEPATTGSLGDALEIAARRVGGRGTVCVLGARGSTSLTSVLTRYPGLRACVVPGPVPPGVAEDRVVVEDVDLVRLGRELGLAARGAAGAGSVLLLDGGDARLDVRLRRGVEEGVLGASGATGPTLGIVTTATEAVALLDEQAALLERGIVPGGPEALLPDAVDPATPGARDGLPTDDLLPTARAIRPVSVVILDAGPASEALAAALAERDVTFVAPTSLVDAGLVPRDRVVLHWSVRWDLPLAAALDRRAGEGADGPDDYPILLRRGPAAVAP